jgi:hypothetical protein
VEAPVTSVVRRVGGIFLVPYRVQKSRYALRAQIRLLRRTNSKCCLALLRYPFSSKRKRDKSWQNFTRGVGLSCPKDFGNTLQVASSNPRTQSGDHKFDFSRSNARRLVDCYRHWSRPDKNRQLSLLREIVMLVFPTDEAADGTGYGAKTFTVVERPEGSSLG